MYWVLLSYTDIFVPLEFGSILKFILQKSHPRTAAQSFNQQTKKLSYKKKYFKLKVNFLQCGFPDFNTHDIYQILNLTYFLQTKDLTSKQRKLKYSKVTFDVLQS